MTSPVLQTPMSVYLTSIADSGTLYGWERPATKRWGWQPSSLLSEVFVPSGKLGPHRGIWERFRHLPVLEDGILML